MKRKNTSDMTGEEGFEARAAFGEDTDIVELEPEDLGDPVETPEYHD